MESKFKTEALRGDDGGEGREGERERGERERGVFEKETCESWKSKVINIKREKDRERE